MDINETDKMILRLLQVDARMRLETIATEVSSSVATVQRRIKAMKEAGIIVRETVVISPKATGFSMSFLILVELEHERIDQIDAFKRKMKSNPRIQQCYYITGEADFSLIVLARDMEDLQELTQHLFLDDSNVKRFRTSVVMYRNKVRVEIPV